MKRILLVFLFVSGISAGSFAQMGKGSWMIDGLITFSREDSQQEFMEAVPGYKEDIELNEFKIRPGIGYFIKDNLAIGVSGTFGYGWRNSDFSQEGSLSVSEFSTETLTYGVGLFARNYFPISDKGSFFAELRSGLSWRKIDLNSPTADLPISQFKSRIFDASGNVGYQYLVTKSIGVIIQTTLLDYSLYQQGNYEENFSKTETEFQLGFRPSFEIGLTIFL
ncbi:MAG TPA: autotransporter outer membrane beta-barrel domain-containing protein [Algoriphagus sp.]|nr:autotransporter outer membrane beta-barrel domain-containing protein [Algoriphagus sp.]